MRISGTQPGVRFLPEDDEIILYLLDKVTGNTLPGNPVFDCDLYGEDEAWKKLFAETGESELYVFTRLRKTKAKKEGELGGGGGKVERTVGSKATWRSNQNDPIYFPGQEDVQIGSKRTFTYRLNERSAAAGRRKKEAAADGFSMTEYRLDGVFGYVATDLVLCSLRRQEERASSEIEIIDAGAPPTATSAWYMRPCGSSAATQSVMGGMVFSC